MPIPWKVRVLAVVWLEECRPKIYALQCPAWGWAGGKLLSDRSGVIGIEAESAVWLGAGDLVQSWHGAGTQ